MIDESKIKYLEFYKAELGNGNHCTKSFGFAVWQHQQKKMDELQKKMQNVLEIIDNAKKVKSDNYLITLIEETLSE